MTIHQAPGSSSTPAAFLILDLDLVRSLDGSYEAAGLLQRIEFRAGDDGWWQPESQAAMFEDAALSRRKGTTALALLRDRGLIESERVTPWNPTLRYRVSREARTVHHVTHETCPTVKHETSSSSVLKEQVRTTPHTPQGASEDQPALIDFPPLRSLPPPDCTEEQFAEFWSLYPRKSSGPKPARAAYLRAVKSATHETIMAGLRAHLSGMACQVQDRARDYRPYATTWLNQARWEAEPPPVVAPDPRDLPSVPDWAQHL